MRKIWTVSTCLVMILSFFAFPVIARADVIMDPVVLLMDAIADRWIVIVLIIAVVIVTAILLWLLKRKK